MTPSQAVVQGTLNADGTLELKTKPDLPMGPVEVTIRSILQMPAQTEDWFSCLQRTRQELEANSYPFMTDREVTSHMEELRAEDDRVEEATR
jgi:hypothetical protein